MWPSERRNGSYPFCPRQGRKCGTELTAYAAFLPDARLWADGSPPFASESESPKTVSVTEEETESASIEPYLGDLFFR